MADMIRADLERAGIDYLDAEGRVFDFHSLRGQYITELGRSGAPQVVVQKLARHADFSTTKRYLDITLADESAAVERLPTIDMTPVSNQEMLATGTDDVPVDPSTNGSASGSISVVPGYHDVSSHVTDDAGQSGTQDRSASDDNSLEASNYDTTCPDVSQHVNDERDQATRRTRTVNLRITNALLCQLSYGGRLTEFVIDMLWHAMTFRAKIFCI